MTAPDHHGADDEFAEDGELPAQGCQNGGITETETDVATMETEELDGNPFLQQNKMGKGIYVLCRHDFEKDWKHSKCLYQGVSSV
jgi:hypothetical protein